MIYQEKRNTDKKKYMIYWDVHGKNNHYLINWFAEVELIEILDPLKSFVLIIIHVKLKSSIRREKCT